MQNNIQEIKFKAINKANNKMLTVDSIEFRKEGIMVFVLCKDGKTREGFWVGCDCELRQYTGLKDKNGKEIYEGDIIKMNEGYCEKGKENIDVVIFNDGMFKTTQDWNDCNYCIGGGYLLDGECLIEIIGNIYEHNNLLK